MRVTFQNNNYGIAVPQQVRDKLPRNDAANFTGKSDIAVKPAKSKLFEPLKAKFRNIDNKMTGWLTENYAKKLADNSVVNWVADKFKNDKYFYNHVTTVGSIITSGLYAHRTLKNDQLDKDRRNTLAINQLLTLGVSTAGAYTLDASMDKWWNRVTAGYAGVQLKDDAFKGKFKAAQKLDGGAKVESLIKKMHGDSALTKTLEQRLRGMGLLKKMIVICSVYRYIVPVAVTPIANRLGDRYLESKKQKA